MREGPTPSAPSQVGLPSLREGPTPSAPTQGGGGEVLTLVPGDCVALLFPLVQLSSPKADLASSLQWGSQ